MSKIPRVVQVPGAAPATTTEEQDDVQVAPEGELAQLLKERDAEVAALRAQLAEASAATDKATKDAAQAIADRAAMGERLSSNKPTAGLQPQDVDPHKIKRAVLTEKGWVCPAQSPSAPAGVR